MAEEGKELQVQVTPSDIMALAKDEKFDIAKMEKLMDFQERWEARQAKQAYVKAMVEVHKKMPTVRKSLDNDQTRSNYASLDEIIVKAKEVYTEEGFSITFYEGETSKENHIRICADVFHSIGHKEDYYYDVPLDGVGIKGNANMTKIHAKASSISYGRRYLMCMIWNIPTGDDDDGNAAGSEFIDENQIKKITDIINAKNITIGPFLKMMKCEEIKTILKRDYKKASVALGLKK